MNKSRTVLLSVVLLSVPAFRSHANPLGGAVQAGSATITHKGNAFTTVNQSSDKVIIDWNSFSIGAGEVTRFVQPSANAAALNRVLGGNPTEIYGLLQANGQVMVINPAGILVGRGGTINTHSFAGSTLDVNNANFLSGVGLRFSGDSTASVRNQGSIQALGGDVFLFAHQVENSGSIAASQGTVGMAAGSEILLSQNGSEHIHVLAGNVQAPATATGVNNVGAVQAATAELKAAGGNIYALAINNGGIVRANTLVNQGGHIYLRSSGGNIQNSGTLDASGKTGGSVVVDGGHNAPAPATVLSSGSINVSGNDGAGGRASVLGDQVGLVNSAAIDASGSSGGGTILVGGDFHGANPDVQNASRTYVGTDVKLNADAVNSGNGGKVVVWADAETRYFGSIFARGGEHDGNGGNVEVSGKELLTYDGTSDLRAFHGELGTLLLDPKSVTIINANNGGSLDGTQTGSNPFTYTVPDNAANTISRGVLEAFGPLANVIIDAADGITINSLATAPTSHTLDLNATTGSLTLNAGTGDFSMQAGDTIQTHGGAVTISGNGVTVGSIVTTGSGNVAGGNVNLTAAGALSISGNITAKGGTASNNRDGQVGGNVSLSGSSISVGGNIDLSGSAGNTGGSPQKGGNGGSVTMTTSSSAAPANSITIGGSVVTAGGAGDGGGAAGAAGTISLSANTLNLNGTSDAGSAQVPFNTTVNAVVLNKTGGNTFINETDGIDVSGSTTGSLNVNAGGPITQSASLTAPSATFNTPGQDITLQDPGNDFTTVSFNGANVNVVDKNALDLGPSTVTGSLSVSTAGNLTDSGAVTVTGTTTLAVGGTHDITLDNADDFGGAVAVQSGNNVVLKDQNSIVLAASLINGTLDVTSGGNGTPGAQITETGVLNVGGLSTFHVAANNSDVLLGSSANLFNGVALATAGGSFHDVSIHDAAAAPTFVTGLAAPFADLSLQYDNSGVALPSLNVSGALTVTASGPITQTAGLTVGGLAAFKTLNDAGAAITLDQVADTVNNSFGSISAQVRNSLDIGNATADIVIHEDKAGGTLLAGVQTGGNLTVVSAGTISENAALIVSGAGKTATFTANGTDAGLALDTQANNLSAVVGTITGPGVHDLGLRNINSGAAVPTLPAGLHNLTLRFDNADINLPAVTLTAGGNLQLVAGGNISDTGDIVVPGTTSLQGLGPNHDALFTHNDDFAGGISLSGLRDVTLNEINGLSISGTATRNLTTTSAGATTFGTLHVGGALNSTANGLISDSGNVTVAGTTTLAAGNTQDIQLTQNDDFGLAVTINSARDVSLNDINTLTVGGALARNLTLNSGAGLSLNALNVGNNLNATAGGNIADLGAITVNGATTLSASSANDITLNHADSFVGPVSIQSGKDVTLNSLNNLTLGPSTISGALSVTANGPISDNGNVTVAGATTLAAGNLNGITFNHADDFGGPVSIVSGNNVTLNDINGLTLGPSVVSGNLAVTAGGPIDQTGPLTVTTPGSFASFSAAGNAITLNDANNDFVTTLFNGSDVIVNDVNALGLGASTISGNFTVGAGGPISQSGTLLVNGAGKSATFRSPGNTITLADPNNDFTSVKLTGSDVTLVDANSLDLGAANISGNLAVLAGGSISQSGALNVNGAGKLATFIAPAGADILLGSFANNLTAVNVTVNGAGSLHDLALRNISAGASLTGLPLAGLHNLTLHFDSAPVNLPAVIVTGDLNVTGLGITDSGNIVVAGLTTLTTPGSGHDIVLNHADDFGLGVNLSASRDVFLNEINLLEVSGLVPGNLSTTAGGGTQFGALQVRGNLSATANGQIFDSGNVSVSGTTSLSAGSANDILLTHADDFGLAVTIAAARNVTLNDVNTLTVGGSIGANLTTVSSGSLTLNGSAVGANLIVNSGGNVNQTAPVTVAGNTTLAAGPANNIALSSANDFVGPVSITGGNNVSLNDINTLTLGPSTISGNLALTANGLISDSGNISVAGSTSLAAGANNIQFSHADDFGGPVTILNSKDVSLVDINALTVGGTVGGKLTTTSGGALTLNALTVGADLTANANGAISDAGAVVVAGTTTLAAGAANNISLSQADDFVGPVNIVSAKDVALNDINTLTVGGTVSGSLSTISGGALTLNALNVAANLSSTANGPIADAGVVTVGGATSLGAGAANNITLSQADDFVGPVTFASGKDVSVRDINALTVGGTVSGKLTTSSGGALTLNALTVGNDLNSVANGPISDAGAVVVGGNTSLSAGTGNNINLSQGDDFVGPVNIVSANDVTLNDINTLTVGGAINGKLTTSSGGALTLNTLNVGGNLASTAGGAISDAGAVKIGGTTTLTAGGNDITLS
ncbi:MAG TPA: filamentous hemagglutinin N-terminal domain-containing protein, partial [Verrucomicrobiae bacterium]|nr:filamentous hemagglutinin N-terminal domain-containing protein [Verrucomicrobiae bacterium]